MKKRVGIAFKLNIFIALISMIFLSAGKSHVQNFLFRINPESKIEIQGTSTLHDWTAYVGEVEGRVFVDALQVQLANKGNWTFSEQAQILIPVKSIKSNNSARDNVMYETFKADKYPEIQFNLDYIKPLYDKGNTHSLIVGGTTSMAGVTRQMEVIVDITPYNGHQFLAKGSLNLNMTDFGMEPPRAFFGALKVHENINVEFELLIDKILHTNWR